jgi:hypothetical protein
MDEQPEQIRGAREGLGIIKHLRAMGASPGEALEVLRRHREEIVAQGIRPPAASASDVDMQLELERAIERPLSELVDAAIQAGWPPKVVFAALRDAVTTQEVAYSEDPDPADDPTSAGA